MHSFSLVLIFLALDVLAGRLAAQAETQPSAESVLDRFDKELGEPAARAAVKNHVVTGTLAFRGVPGGGTFEKVSIGDDRVKLETRVESDGGCGGASTQGCAGDMAWSTDPALGVTIRYAEDAGPVRRQFAIGRSASWRTLYAKAELAGREAVDGRDCWKIRMIPASGAAETWFVDVETTLLRRADFEFPNPIGGTFPLRTLYADWRRMGGVLYPWKSVQEIGGMAIICTVESVKQNAELTPDRVAPPAEVVEAAKDPKHREKKELPKAGDAKVETLAAQPVLSIRAVIDAKDVSKTLAEFLPEVMAAIGKAGGQMAAPPFSRYHAMDGGKIDLEAGIPLKKAVAGHGRVKASELPAGRAAMTWHLGPYDKLPGTHAFLQTWMQEQKLEAAGGAWEIYWTDPGIEPDPAKWQTQIFWPLK
jgi:effector-binding domain-containing protein